MSQISTYENIVKKIQKLDLNNRNKGTIFEKLSKYLLEEKDTSKEYKEISLWSEWKYRGNEIDTGIDIVIETYSGEFIAVQCKFYQDISVGLNDLSTFFAKLQSGIKDIKFSKGIIITTSDLTQKAQKQVEQIRKTIPIDLITEQDFIESNIDWEKLDPTKTKAELPLHAKKKPREHQREAIEATQVYFSNPNHTRGKLIMACGTGKTFTSLKILENITQTSSIGGIVLFLAPSISLVSQTFREYCTQKSEPFVACIVCSDSKSGQSEDDVSFAELSIAPSTNTQDILKSYQKAKNEKKRLIIFSTYQSALRIKEAQSQGLEEIDLMICDEAHRSVGAMYSLSKEEREVMLGDMADEALNSFTLCHSNEHIKAKRRLYMTATPKIYKDSAKSKAKESDNTIFSMDDEEIFGEEIYTLNFDTAIKKGLLTDYKVMILALRSQDLAGVANSAISKLKAEGTKLHNRLIDSDFVCKIIGTHKGLAKQDLIALDADNQQDNDLKDSFDKTLSRRAINFCRNIATSKNIINSFKTILECYDEELKRNSFKNLEISIDHIDGSMNAKTRLDKLTRLDNPNKNTCNVLSNARCLSEGIDVPALDSIVFFDGRNAMVDIIQAVGRVMRKAEGKEMGYIILPIALSESEIKNIDKAVNNTNFQNIWKVLKSLRSHDPSLVDEAVFKEKIKIVLSDDTPLTTDPKKQDETSQKEQEKEQMQALFDITTLHSLANAVYNVMPTKLGDKGYWESFSAKTAKIVETLNIRLRDIFAKNPLILKDFLTSLKTNIHNFIAEDEAIDMICSHIITKPIFDAIFGEEMSHNPIGKALDEVLDKIKVLGLDNEESSYLNKLYKNVRENAELAKSQKSKQELIKNLYDTFFRTAFKKQSEKLGIVYTPIEIIDFILHSTNDLLKKHFNTNFNDSNIEVFDPFTGTGSFITRLISKDNHLISDDNLKDKFQKALFAQDIVLLSYYIALINITQTAKERDSSLSLFKNIALTDSLDYLENKTKDENSLFPALNENKKIKSTIEDQEIRVIVGNPPYSAGAESQNDNNANIPHPELEKRVKDTYTFLKDKKSGKGMGDTLIQAIRMASDKITDQGIIGFVVNGSFIDSTSADGFRKCVAKEFSDIYILNLRGNTRNKGEMVKREGGKIFDSGSRATVAIVFFIKDSKAKESKIHYYDIGDYLSREQKLSKISELKSALNTPFINIIPNKKGDWINQRGEDFDKLIPLKGDKDTQGIFLIKSTGIITGRDPWVYNFSQEELKKNMQTCIDTYNQDLVRFNKEEFLEKHKGTKSKELYKILKQKITTDKTKISWVQNLLDRFLNKKILENFIDSKIRNSLYRPFVKERYYYDADWSWSLSKTRMLFSAIKDNNIEILVSSMATREFSSFISDTMVDYQTLPNTQVYPLYYYDEASLEDKKASQELIKKEAIADFALSLFQEKLKDTSITKKEIFYYIYAIFHHKKYLNKYKAELSKEAPRVGISKDFKILSKLGEELANLHLDYENGSMYQNYEHKDGLMADTNKEGYYDVLKMKKVGKDIIYNQNITIKDIPEKAYKYEINGKSAVDWIIERYQVSIDKDSLIKNNPNHYAGGKYIFELLLRVIELSIKSVDLIEEISKKEFEYGDN